MANEVYLHAGALIHILLQGWQVLIVALLLSKKT